MIPTYIAGCYGVLHPATGPRGVVICGSLGDESLNAYRAQVFLGELLAQAGFPTLRISYYGTGDSAGSDEEPGRFQSWIHSIGEAVRWLRETTEVTSVTLCGLRIGAALAARAASEIPEVDSLALLAPVGNGRRFSRELTLTARTVADIWQSRSPINDGQWFEAHGLRLDRATHEALEALDISRLQPEVQRVLMLDQPGVPPNDRLAEHLRAQGIDVRHEPGFALDRLLADSHEAAVPYADFARVAEWLGEPPRANRSPRPVVSGPLELATFAEAPVALGPDSQLAGILATPHQRDGGKPVVLIASTGANPRFGTSRGAVVVARWLAEHGIASLRMDGHGIGDSALSTGERGAPYSKLGDQDVCSGVEYLATHFDAPIIVLGMCSGAYHAFQAALTEPRIAGLILVNLQKFVWQDGESLSVVQRTTLRTTQFYLRNLVNLMMWRRLLRGQINVPGITRALAGRALRQLAAAADPAVSKIRGETNVGKVRRQLDELSRRGTHILYVLSGNDPGLDEIEEYFGFRGWRLRRNPSIMFHTMEGADHTLSAHWARRALQDAIAHFLTRRFGVAASHAAEKQPAEAVWPAAARKAPGIVIDSAPTAA